MRFQSTLPVWGATQRRICAQIRHRISIHAPRVGSDCWIHSYEITYCKFQSTLPVWGATGGKMPWKESTNDFNPRSPCGERQCSFGITPNELRFQSTLPVWGATNDVDCLCIRCSISIHAPRVGSDPVRHTDGRRRCDFNPRSPCGERHRRSRAGACREGFQSTLPVWGAT